MTNTPRPILYSFRRCPYAMRARLAIAYAQQCVELREVVLKNKPPEMLAISPKATVPVLQLLDASVIDESRDVMYWALQSNDPHGLLAGEPNVVTTALLDENDGDFKHWLDRYKYADRYPEYSAEEYRAKGEVFLQKLELRLQEHAYLGGDKPHITDIGTMPFVRQFSMVDKVWFDQAPYPALRAWLEWWLASEVFVKVMKKYSPWRVGQELVLLDFGDLGHGLTTGLRDTP
ncbi:MAG: glutathione S-transferase [Gammaproteobacteria bacterium]